MCCMNLAAILNLKRNIKPPNSNIVKPQMSFLEKLNSK